MTHIKATSPGVRWLVKTKPRNLYTGKLLRKLTKSKPHTAGRNNQGKITTHHKGGKQKQRQRLIDFKRNKINVPGIIKTIEYDPNRNAFISLIHYIDGEKKYILNNKHSKTGDCIIASETAEIKTGNAMPIKNIPIGTKVCCIENEPGKGAVYARAAGTSFTIINKCTNYCIVKTPKNELRKINNNCKATIGEIGNQDKYLEKLGKAGRNRLKGIRPTVRGVAMNPIDHPHGGGEGKTTTKRHPVNFKGKKTKGKKTRTNKRTRRQIINR
ncbi:50S ribosomal protein L2 [Candidatus Vidania fulgoroideae]|uniref:Large ribosomal subunit protein uL2 n=1 Tax=Candidatus Vidania fulgoroideorum TaxID=881286 RepID=A0A974XA28_9PROT|nr:50S ribosomal protein L2 [Candidatus Vidania fulgoroideae]